MRVVVASDFHGRYPSTVPPCDLLLLAGDCLPPAGFGSRPAGRSGLMEFIDWLTVQPAKQIVGIAGNHDFIAESDHGRAIVRALPWLYLEDEGAEVVDGVKVWGSPWSTMFGSWAFMLPDDQLAERWALIPDDTEILVVHGPAKGILDKVYDGRHEGSVSLRERLRQLPHLRLLATGHIHEAYGTTAFTRQEPDGGLVQVPCVNGSYMDGRYVDGGRPIVVDV